MEEFDFEVEAEQEGHHLLMAYVDVHDYSQQLHSV